MSQHSADQPRPTTTAERTLPGDGTYSGTWRRSVEDREGFWLEAAQGIDWMTPPSRALDGSGDPIFRWFPEATLNTCANAVDRHVAAGRGDQAAIIYDSAVLERQETITYAQLQERVAQAAGVLRELGVQVLAGGAAHQDMAGPALKSWLALCASTYRKRPA